jgi:lysophospholipase L1-like esterase
VAYGKHLNLRPSGAIRRVRTIAYAKAWERDNRRALASTGPLWIVLGDSTAQGIGASKRTLGYVHRLLSMLRTERDSSWRVMNLSQAGATVRDVIDRQLPNADDLPRPALLSCAIGINDVLAGSSGTEEAFRRLSGRLPCGALLAGLPQGYDQTRSEQINALIATLVQGNRLTLVDLWEHTGGPSGLNLASDGIHPSDAGYRNWAEAFYAAVQRSEGCW